MHISTAAFGPGRGRGRLARGGNLAVSSAHTCTGTGGARALGGVELHGGRRSQRAGACKAGGVGGRRLVPAHALAAGVPEGFPTVPRAARSACARPASPRARPGVRRAAPDAAGILDGLRVHGDRGEAGQGQRFLHHARAE
jgi:hypothetical protein